MPGPGSRDVSGTISGLPCATSGGVMIGTMGRMGSEGGRPGLPAALEPVLDDFADHLRDARSRSGRPSGIPLRRACPPGQTLRRTGRARCRRRPRRCLHPAGPAGGSRNRSPQELRDRASLGGWRRPVVQHVGVAGRPDPGRHRRATRRTQTASRPTRSPPGRSGRRRDPHRRARIGRGSDRRQDQLVVELLYSCGISGEMWPGRGRWTANGDCCG